MLIKIPGKLMLAGEYAVTKKNNLSIVMAINKFIYKNHSELINENGVKYGLGSSGAYAVLQTKIKYPELNDDQLFQEALKFSRQSQPLNSGADIAASIYTGTLIYTKDNYPIQLKIPEKWQLLVGWTKRPSITSELVAKMSLQEDFTNKSNQYTRKLVEAIRTSNFNSFNSIIKELEDNLETLSGILTDEIKLAIKITQQFGINSKISGSGGGDNVIAFVNNNEIALKIKNEWKNNNIEPLDIKIYTK
ncbi:MAG: kinase [Lactobacillaceae bacterium]|nr:kinase [Lactobacillaceae bacterium]